MCQNESKKRISCLDCTRAICMLWIICVWHMSEYINLDIVCPLSENTTNGVLAAFTLISGYLMGMKTVENKSDVFYFYKKRLLRFYPLFFLSCSTFLVAYLLWGLEYIRSVPQYILTLTGLSCIFTPAPQTIWFISMLILFYVITPLILFQDKKIARVVLCLVLYILLLVLNNTILEVDNRVLLFFPFYCIGILAARRISISDKCNYILLVLSIVLFVLLNMVEINMILMKKILLSVVFVTFIIQLGKLCTKSILSTKILKFISYASMCAYLFHRQFFGVIERLFGNFHIWSAYVLIIPSLIVGSYAMQYIYDKCAKKIIN